MTDTTPHDAPARSDEGSDRGPEGVGWKKTLVACAAILAVAAGIAAITFVTEPTAERGGATRETAMLARVIEVERGSFAPEIVATGVARPTRDIVLRPRIAGEIVARAPAFTPGGVVEKGEVLVRLEAADYRNVLAQRKSALRQAIAALEIEKGRQTVAASDYALVDIALPEEQKALALRQPQLEAAKVEVEAARASVEQAELDLRRTTIEAPFAAHILTREVDVGSQVSPDDALGRLVGLDSYWVELTVPQSDLPWIQVPRTPEQAGAPVRVRNRTVWPDGVFRAGEVARLIGALDEGTRMARVLVTIPDPLGRRTEPAPDGPPLMVGEFLEARIRGTQLDDVVRLAREHVRDGDTVWVMEDGRLRIRAVDIVMRDHQHAYISRGLEDGDRVVISDLATVTDGARLRLEDGAPAEPADR